VIEIQGKQVFAELAELVAPAHTALLLIDMQRDFVEPDGSFGSLGIDLTMYDETQQRPAELLNASMLLMRHRFDLASSAEIADAWRGDASGGQVRT
jgi:hypothetical protein